MPRALADHSTATLLRYARTAFAEAAAYCKGNPTTEAQQILMRAAEALRMATWADPRSSQGPLATEINEVVRTLNALGWPCKL